MLLDFYTAPCSFASNKKRDRKSTKSSFIQITIFEPSDENNSKSYNSNIESSFPASSSTRTFSAFDEIFIGEKNAMRVSYVELQVDGGEINKQKNSGIHVSIEKRLDEYKVDSAQLNDMISLIKELGFEIQPPIESKVENVDELCEMLENVCSPLKIESGLSFRLKEPVFNSTFKTIPDRGVARQIWIRSKYSNGQIIIDHKTSIPFNFGTELLIEFCSNPNLKLG